MCTSCLRAFSTFICENFSNLCQNQNAYQFFRTHHENSERVMAEGTLPDALVSYHVPGIKKRTSSGRARIVYKQELVRHGMIRWKKQHLG